jgi:hypothetical protein
MPMNEKDSREQTIKDRHARTWVALISAGTAIGTAYIAALQGIDKLATEKDKPKFELITCEASMDESASGGVYLFNPESGETWFAKRKSGTNAEWVKIEGSITSSISSGGTTIPLPPAKSNPDNH